MAVGFGRVGALALHLGVLLTVSALLALMTVLVTPTAALVRQVAAVALAAGCLSTRFVVQGYDAVGYTISGVCLGFALVAVLAIEDEGLRDRVVGGLITLAILHYSYVGVALALPLCAAWLLVRRHPLHDARTFALANPILLLVLVLLAISMTTHPELALARAYDVVAGVGSKVPLRVSLARKLGSASVPRILAVVYQRWVVQNQGSWHLVDLAPLGGPSVALLSAMWAGSWIVAPRRGAAMACMVGFVALLGALSLLEHVITDAADYRDFPFVFAVTAAGLLFILRAPALGGVHAALAWGLAIVVAAVNFGDVALLAGHRHASADYGPAEVGVLEALRRMTDHHGREDLGAARIVVPITDTATVPLRGLYTELLRARGFTVVPQSTAAFCQDRDQVVRAASAGCEPFLLAYPVPSCGLERAFPGVSLVAVLRYDEPCRAGEKRLPSAMLLATR